MANVWQKFGYNVKAGCWIFFAHQIYQKEHKILIQKLKKTLEGSSFVASENQKTPHCFWVSRLFLVLFFILFFSSERREYPTPDGHGIQSGALRGRPSKGRKRSPKCLHHLALRAYVNKKKKIMELSLLFPGPTEAVVARRRRRRQTRDPFSVNVITSCNSQSSIYYVPLSRKINK